jgi:predicted PolB exonuclease-like 3'-5' exonuclease
MRALLSFDIETVPIQDFENYPESIQQYISKKIESQKEKNPDFDYSFYASIDGDFGKIVCISMATFDASINKIRMKSLYGDDEKSILQSFKEIIDRHQGLYLHYNGLNFDVPFIIKRMYYHGLEANYHFANLRRFSSDPHFDLMQEWAKYDMSRAKTLELLSFLHQIPSPKEILDGSKVFKKYLEKDWKTIVKYCEYDSATVLNLYLKIYQRYKAFTEADYVFSE